VLFLQHITSINMHCLIKCYLNVHTLPSTESTHILTIFGVHSFTVKHFTNAYCLLHFPLTCRITSSYLSSLSSMGYWPLLSACRRWCWARNWWIRSVRDWPPTPPGAAPAWLDAEDVEPSRRWCEWWTPTGKGPPGSEIVFVVTCSWRLLET